MSENNGIETNSNENELLSNRNEFLFLYDIKMGNPNGDPDENRPRQLPDSTFFATDVRLKRFIRDYLKQIGNNILVDTIDGRTTNLTGRVSDYLEKNKLPKAEGVEIVKILLDAFIDARLFGSSFAFKKEEKSEEGKKDTKKYDPKPIPKTLTGPVQINMGEVLHEAEEIDIHGTTTFGSDQEKSQGTFTQYYGLRYGLIGFSGIANENSAKISRLMKKDFGLFLKAMWKSVRENANTRSKKAQMPHLLINIQYKPGTEFQFGRLHDYVKLVSTNGKSEKEWSKPDDYIIDLTLLETRLGTHMDKIEKIFYEISDDCKLGLRELKTGSIEWERLNLDKAE